LERLNDPIDLLVTDLIMPDMTGCELADRVRAVQPGLCLWYMSGYTDEMITHHGLSIGAGQLLQKPFTSTELLQKVREVLDADLIRNPEEKGASIQGRVEE